MRSEPARIDVRKKLPNAKNIVPIAEWNKKANPVKTLMGLPHEKVCEIMTKDGRIGLN
jgi:hypothetical protein